MEFTFHYFWLIKLLIAAISLFASYKAIMTHGFKSKFWNITAAIILILAVISPVKIDSTQTKQVNQMMTKQIADRHLDIPPLKTDNSFKENAPIGITQEDLK